MIVVSSPQIEVEPPPGWRIDEALEALVVVAEPASSDGFVANAIVVCDRVRSDAALEELVGANLAQLQSVCTKVVVRHSGGGDGYLDRVLELERDALSLVQYQRFLLYPSGVTNKVHWLLQIQASCLSAKEAAYGEVFGHFVSSAIITPPKPADEASATTATTIGGTP